MARNKVALELNDTGIYDFVQGQNTNWNNVVSIKKIEFIKGQEFFRIGFILANNEEFIRDRFFFFRPFYRITAILFSTPFLIRLHFLNGTNEEILYQVQDYYRQIKSDS